MIHGLMRYGIYMRESDDADISFNSIYSTYTGGSSHGIYIDNPDNLHVPSRVSNNAIDNDSGTSYVAICIDYLDSMPDQMDYNNWFDRDSGFARIGGGSGAGTYSDMNTWRSATGRDAHSLTSNPQFIAPSDLHITISSPNYQAGVYNAAVPLDFDGEFRNDPPDIGADEAVGAITPVPTQTPFVTPTSATDTATPGLTSIPTASPAGLVLLVLVLSLIIGSCVTSSRKP